MQEGAGQKLSAGAAAEHAAEGYAEASEPATATHAGAAVSISGLDFPRYLSTAGVDPFDEVEWEIRDAVIGTERGNVVFEQREVESRRRGRSRRPTSWCRSISVDMSAPPSASGP